MSGGHAEKSEFQKWFDLAEWTEWMGDWGISRALFLGVLFLGLLFVLSLQIANLPLFALWWIAGTAPVWLPIVLVRGAWHAWTEYIREDYLSRRNPILLEVKIPRDIMKSPRAMELVFNSFYVTSGEVTFFTRAWEGAVRPWFSWELASFGGEIHFYVWCWGTYRRLVESSIYAQYPEVEIYEVEDYASKFVFDPEKYNCYCTNYIYDPREDAYPIKSYIDFELDKDPKEEFKVEPLAQVFETLSNLKPHEQVWIQIMARATGKETSHAVLNPKNGFKLWKKRVEDAIKDIRKEASLNPGKEDAPDSDEKKYGFPRPTWKQTEQMRAMERHLGKVPFDVGMRGIYISSGDFHGATYTAMRWIWKPFNSPAYFNQLRPRHAHNPFDYPWQDFRNYRWNLTVRRHLDAYRQRSFFYTPYPWHAEVMSPETLATLYHYPSRTVQVPGLQRIAAKKAEAPPNLPR